MDPALAKQLEGLGDEEKRKVLMALLMEDNMKDDGDSEDGSLQDEITDPPELDDDGRTATVENMTYTTRAWRSVLDLSDGAREEIVRDCKKVFPLDGSNWLAAESEPRCALEHMAKALPSPQNCHTHATNYLPTGYFPVPHQGLHL